MKPTTDDPIARGLAELPGVPIERALAEGVRRRARDVLVESGRPVAWTERLSATWTGSILPGILVSSGAAYTWISIVMLGRIFGSG